MKRIYKKPMLRAHRIETTGVVCVSAKGLRWSTTTSNDQIGAWADSRAWGGTLTDDDETTSNENEW